MGLSRLLLASASLRITCLSVFGMILLPTSAQSTPQLPECGAGKEGCSDSNSVGSVASTLYDSVSARNRLHSARELTAEAARLTALSSILAKWSQCIATLEKETPRMGVEEGNVSESQDEINASKNSPKSKQNFQQLLFAYQDARRQYLQHKILYDQHVTQFHNQPQTVQTLQPTSSNQPPMVAAPHLQMLKLQVADACTQLQLAEQVLTQTESELASTVNYLTSIKGKGRAESYASIWSGAQSLGASLQRQVVDYGNVILRKQTSCEDEMHTLEQSAITNGDFNQSRKVYLEVQRDSALNNEETMRAHQHTMFAAQILGRIGALSPLLAAPVQSSAQGAIVTFDEIQNESQALQAEYESLQQKYRAEQDANPARKGR